MDMVKKVFNDFLKEFKDYAAKFFKENKEELVNEAKTILEANKEALTRWTNLWSEQQITQDDLNDLIAGRLALAKLEALKAKGLTKAKMDRIKAAIIDILTDTIFKLIPS